MFVYKNNVNKHPTTLAAVMTSVTKEKRDYEYFARFMEQMECALESGFESVRQNRHIQGIKIEKKWNLLCSRMTCDVFWKTILLMNTFLAAWKNLQLFRALKWTKRRQSI